MPRASYNRTPSFMYTTSGKSFSQMSDSRSFTEPQRPFSSATNISSQLSLPAVVKTDHSLRDHLQKLSDVQLSNVVVGNESADLDSIVCALMYSVSRGSHTLTLPLINAFRQDLSLRRDVLLALSLANVSDSLLHFMDDSSTTSLLSRNDLSVTLVDHNALAPSQTYLGPRVSAIVDHHVDDKQFLYANPRLIAPVGSCATLIAELMMKNSSEMPIQPSFAMLLLSAILLDCHNMDKRVGKGTPRDEEVVNTLVKCLGISNTDKDALFDTLFAARMDISGFSANDLLRKDVKVVAKNEQCKVAICSVGVQTQDFVERAKNSLVADVKQLFTMWGVQNVIVMLAFTDQHGAFRREMLIHSDPVGSFIAKELPAAKDGLLELAQYKSNQPHSLSGFHYFNQGNAKASRKVVLPLIKEILSRYIQ